MRSINKAVKPQDSGAFMIREFEGHIPQTAEDRLMARLQDYRQNPTGAAGATLLADITAHQFPINAVIQGKTVLGFAAEYRLEKLMDAVLSNPFCNPDVLDGQGHNALSVAFRYGYFDMAQKLLDGGANINTRLKIKSGGTALHTLARLDNDKLAMREHFAKDVQDSLKEKEAFFTQLINAPNVGMMSRDYDDYPPIDLCQSRAISDWFLRDGRVKSYVLRTYGTDIAPLTHERAIYLDLEYLEKGERLKRIETAIGRGEHNLVSRLLEPDDYEESELRRFLSRALYVDPIERTEHILRALINAGADINHTDGAFLEHILNSDKLDLTYVKLGKTLGLKCSALSERRAFEILKRNERIEWSKDVGISNLMLSDALNKIILKVIKCTEAEEDQYIPEIITLLKAGATFQTRIFDRLIDNNRHVFLNKILPHYSKTATQLSETQMVDIFKRHIDDGAMLSCIHKNSKAFGFSQTDFETLQSQFCKAFFDNTTPEQRGEALKTVIKASDISLIQECMNHHRSIDDRSMVEGIRQALKRYEASPSPQSKAVLTAIFQVQDAYSKTPDDTLVLRKISDAAYEKLLERQADQAGVEGLKYILDRIKCANAASAYLSPRALYELSDKAQKRMNIKSAKLLQDRAFDLRLQRLGTTLSNRQAKTIAKFERDLFKDKWFKDKAKSALEKLTGVNIEPSFGYHTFDEVDQKKLALLFGEYVDLTLKELQSQFLVRCLSKLPEDDYWNAVQSILESEHDYITGELLSNPQSERAALKMVQTVIQKYAAFKKGDIPAEKAPSEHSMRIVQTWSIRQERQDLVEQTLDMGIMTEGLFKYNASIMALSPDTKDFSEKLYRAQSRMRASRGFNTSKNSKSDSIAKPRPYGSSFLFL